MSYHEISCKNVKGRDIYSCSWCGEKILKGELHQSRFYKFDGVLNNSREHSECVKAMENARENGIDLEEGWMPGDFKRGMCDPR